jgi:hypothetical protein
MTTKTSIVPGDDFIAEDPDGNVLDIHHRHAPKDQRP